MQSTEPSPTQAEADAFKTMSSGGGDGGETPPGVELPTVIDAPAITVGGSVVASCAVGDTLIATVGNWTGEPTAYWQTWLSDSSVAGSGDTYVAQAGDVGHSLSCMVTATNDAGSAQQATNAVSVAAAE